MARRRVAASGIDRQALPALAYQSDPIRLTARSLGGKWTLLLLRDLAFLRLTRFGELLRNNPGLSPRVLSRRLREMQREGLIEREAVGPSVTYRLTPRGADAVYILLAMLRYGLRHHVGPRPLDPAGPASSPAGEARRISRESGPPSRYGAS